MTNAYKTILMQGRKAYSVVIRHILAHPPPSNAFIVHCTAGKDRTGVLCALLLSLCGVDDEIVAEEYSLTELGLGTWTENLVQAVINLTGASEEGARNMVGAKSESMFGALKMIKNEFGGAAAYFRDQCGLSEDEVKQIQQYLIVEEMPVNGLSKN
jgi:protein tyrosine/serine phosphatase